MIPDCLCGNILRGTNEQARGWCVNCIIRIALYEERIKQLLLHTQDTPHWNHIFSTIQQAIRAEHKAMELTSSVQHQAQAYCQALHLIGEALTCWMEADHQFWLLLLQIDTTERAAWEDLHGWCIEERERLYMLYAILSISVQQQVYTAFFRLREQVALHPQIITPATVY